mgnify:CR=1 FL=1
MTRKTKIEEPQVSQADPTAPALRDENGFELDQWALPVCGPMRIARLAELGLPDPHDDPDAWADQLPVASVTAPEVVTSTEISVEEAND